TVVFWWLSSSWWWWWGETLTVVLLLLVQCPWWWFLGGAVPVYSVSVVAGALFLSLPDLGFWCGWVLVFAVSDLVVGGRTPSVWDTIALDGFWLWTVLLEVFDFVVVLGSGGGCGGGGVIRG
ncbi:hypothetical protein A2U01_0044258, partial [Trifolium medium]|nr:hypothetical protein [Trifolium medium]